LIQEKVDATSSTERNVPEKSAFSSFPWLEVAVNEIMRSANVHKVMSPVLIGLLKKFFISSDYQING
jgi:hypothetical protein